MHTSPINKYAKNIKLSYNRFNLILVLEIQLLCNLTIITICTIIVKNKRKKINEI